MIEDRAIEDRPRAPAQPETATGSRAAPAGRAETSTPTVPARWFGPVLAAIAAFGAALRVRMLTVGLPYSSYVDGHFVLEASAHQVAHGTWDTGWSWYPSLLADLTSLTARAMAVFDPGALTAGARTTDQAANIEVIEPASLILAGRLVVFTCSLAIVVLVGLLGARLAGRKVGVLAALLCAVLPTMVHRSAVVITDVPAALFALLALYGAARVLDDERPARWSAVTGVAAGLAFTSKYTTAFVAVAFVVPLVARAGLSARERVRLAAIAAGSAVAAALVTMPRLVLRTSEVRDAMQRTSEAYANWDGGVRYVDEAVAPHELGVPVIVLAAIGLVLLLRHRRSRLATVGYLVFAAVTAAGLAGSSFQPFRNLVPLVPFLCIAAATTVVAGARLLARALPSVPAAGPALALAAFALLCTNFAFGWAVPYGSYRSEMVDTRVQARRFVEERARAGDRIVVAEELGVLPSELHRLADRTGAEVTVASQHEPLEDDDARFVLAGAFRGERDAWSPVLDDREQLAEFGSTFTSCAGTWDTDPDRDPRCPTRPLPDAWHGNDGIVLVYGA